MERIISSEQLAVTGKKFPFIEKYARYWKECKWEHVTLTDGVNTVTVYIFGDSENWDGNEFYQYVLTDDGQRLYKAYYDTDGVELLEDVDYDSPFDIVDVTKIYEDD